MSNQGDMPLGDLRVLDLSQGVPGAYCTKLLVDAGADVVKVEPAGGDPLRRWTLSGTDLNGRDGALFQYLCASKRTGVGTPADALDWVVEADVVVEDLAAGAVDIAALRHANPSLIVTSISPFGRTGPWADRDANDFTLQGWCGSIGGRGEPGRPPLQAGGRLGEWVSGAFAAVATLAAWRVGRGEHVDVSILEAMIRVARPFGLANKGIGARTNQLYHQVPSIVATADGQLGLYLMTRQNYSDFVALIGRPDLDVDDLARADVRFARRVEFMAPVLEWTRQHTSAELTELLTLLRIPVAPITDGATVTLLEQAQACGVFVTNPSGGFRQPRVPYRLAGVPVRPFGPAPERPDVPGPPTWSAPRPGDRHIADPTGPLPLSGIRVLDFTMWWAGPEATDLLAALGAGVIKVESVTHPDMYRALTARPDEERWWEWSMGFHVSNRNKRGITLDLQDPVGLDLAWRLIETADVVIENFKPQVFEALGLTWEAIHERTPRTVMVRMPAFGLDGPWRSRGAFAPTIEMVTGQASTTGYSPEEPIAPSGPADPTAGIHAAFATLLALEMRGDQGPGTMVEVPMIETGLNIAAETLLEYEAYGNLLRPNGNRSTVAAPQGVYPCTGDLRWVAISVQSDDQWRQFAEVTGIEPDAGHTARARVEESERLDVLVAAWCAKRDRDEVVELLTGRGVPVAPVLFNTEVDEIPQLWSRGFLERVKHPVTGTEVHPGHAFRFASRGTEAWLRHPAPTLGQHTEEVLGELGLRAEEIDDLRERSVIGTALVDR